MSDRERTMGVHELPSQSDSTPNEPPKARVGKTLLETLRILWDQLGLMLAVSLTWTFILSLPFSVERALPRGAPQWIHLLAFCLVPVVSALPTCGVFSLAHRVVAHEEAGYSHLWQDGVAMFGVALRLILLQAAVAAILGVSIWFYLRSNLWVSKAALTVSCYSALVWVMMLVYQWPALIAQEKGLFDEPDRAAKRGALAAIRRSFYLALSRPFFTLALLAFLIPATIAMAVTVVVPALLWIGAVALVSTLATRALLVEFRVIPAPVQAEPVADELFRLPEIRR